MTRHSHVVPFLLFSSMAFALVPGHARAAESYDNCTGFVTSLPAVVTTAGTWCLKRNLSTAITTGNAINIAGDRVTLDCNDFLLDGIAAGAGTQAMGVYAHDRHNVTVRNCHVRGFSEGVRLVGIGGSHLVEDNHLAGNTFVGIYTQGDGSLVRRNQVLDTGGTTTTVPTYGIAVVESVDVLNNTVAGVIPSTGGGPTVGIYTSCSGCVYDSASSSVNDNRVRGVVNTGSYLFGIYNYFPGRLILRGNAVISDGTSSSLGVYCYNTATSPARARVKTSTIHGFAIAIGGCGNGGGNDLIN